MCCVVVELTKYSTRDDCWRFGRRRLTSTKTDASGEALAPPDSGNTLLMIHNYRLGQRYVFSGVSCCIIRVCKLLCVPYKVGIPLYNICIRTQQLLSSMTCIDYDTCITLLVPIWVVVIVDKVAQFETNEYVIWERESITDGIQPYAANMTYKIWDSTTTQFCCTVEDWRGL